MAMSPISRTKLIGYRRKCSLGDRKTIVSFISLSIMSINPENLVKIDLVCYSRNAWQSLACSRTGIAVSPPGE